MWPFRKKLLRRVEAALARDEARLERWRRLRQSGAITGAWIGLLFAAAGTAILAIGGRGSPHQLGERVQQPYVARVDFEADDPAAPGRTLHFKAGQQIASAGVIDEDEYALLQAEQAAYVAKGKAGALVLHLVGLASVMLLATGGLGLYVGFYEPRILHRPARALALAGLLLAVMLGARLTALATWQTELHVFAATAATVLAVMILTVVYSQRFALGCGSLLSLLMILAVQQNYLFLLVLIAGLIPAALGLSEIRTRGKLAAVGLTCAVVMALTTLGVDLIGGRWQAPMVRQALSAGAGGLAGGLLMQGLLPLVEWAFGIATAITLLEFSDVSRPLLRRLATEAPGTFNHSLLLGSLAEAAAESIGADGLLARVGAYYHDVGKINKPAYFVENQEGGFSRHAKLTPAMSLLIILGHVKDGLELAKEYNLPRVIWPFITEHHGTTLVQFFYQAAARQSADQEPPAEAQFRYPGPKPQSKETAILMLCDAVEGATRSLAEPTPGRIEDVVHQIARKKLDDGQLDECSLTLRELHVVEQSFIKSLWGFYHGRIVYPSEPDKETGNGKPA